MSEIKKSLINRGFKVNRFLTESLRGVPFLIFFVSGIYAALISSALGSQWQSFLSQLILIIILGYTTIFFSKLAIGFIRLYSQTSEGLLPLTSLFENLTRLLIFIIGFFNYTAIFRNIYHPIINRIRSWRFVSRFSLTKHPSKSILWD